MHGEPREADSSELPGRGTNPTVGREEPLATVPLSAEHRIDKFVCEKSQRVASFFKREFQVLVPHNYCRVFILPSEGDPTEIWGFYTLSPSALTRSRATGGDQKRVPGGLPIPMILIGFMGRHDAAPKGIGEALVVDAARRVYRNIDIPAWGLMLDSEGGSKNKKLWEWYKAQGFTPAKEDKAKPDANSGVMYGALKKFLPELQT